MYYNNHRHELYVHQVAPGGERGGGVGQVIHTGNGQHRYC